MTEAFVFDAIRTPRGKGKKDGSLYEVKPVNLLAGLLTDLQQRHGFDTALVAPVGLTVTANILVDQQEAMTVPRTALSGEAVFLLKGGRAVLSPLTVIEWPAARLIVTKGLAAGDQVIADSTGLTDGLAVTVAATIPVTVTTGAP